MRHRGRTRSFKRGAGGWSQSSLTVPGLGVQSFAGVLPDMSDFSRFAISVAAGSGGNELGYREVNEVGAPNLGYELLSERASTGGFSAVAGASSKIETVVLTTWCPGEGALGCDPGGPCNLRSGIARRANKTRRRQF